MSKSTRKIISCSTTSDVSKVASQIINDIQRYDWTNDSDFLNIVAKLNVRSRMLDEAIKREDCDNEAEKKDYLRDVRLKCVFFLVKAFIYHHDREVAIAAYEIDKILLRFEVSQLISDDYTIETSQLTSFIGELNRENLKDVLSKMPVLETAIEKLDIAQQEYMLAYARYEHSRVKYNDMPSAYKLKNFIINYINNDLCLYVSSMSLLKKGFYKYLSVQINNAIRANNDIVRGKLREFANSY